MATSAHLVGTTFSVCAEAGLPICRTTWHAKVLDLFLDTALLVKSSDAAAIKDLGALLQPLMQAASACRISADASPTMQKVWSAASLSCVRHPDHSDENAPFSAQSDIRWEIFVRPHQLQAGVLRACVCQTAMKNSSPLPIHININLDTG